MQELTIENIAARLDQLTILELRQTAKAVGVACPAAGKKSEVREKIIAVANGTDTPVAHGESLLLGFADKELVKEILTCRQSTIGK